MVHFFDSHIAQKYGVNAAVLAGFLWDCAEEKSTRKKKDRRGKTYEESRIFFWQRRYATYHSPMCSCFMYCCRRFYRIWTFQREKYSKYDTEEKGHSEYRKNGSCTKCIKSDNI